MAGGPTGNPYAGNRHADVLNTEPEDDAAKLRLVDEVKNRAKGAFAQKDMPSAEALFGKVITLLDSMPGKSEATPYSNRSMVRLNLNKVEEALADAKKCLDIDPTFVKGYHRKAQALMRLNEFDEAIACAKAGMELEPANKAWEELIKKAEEDKEKDAEDKAKLKRDAQDVRVELHNASTSRASQKAAKKEGQAGDETTEMRGYKTTSDGKTTSYFHTEISQEAKDLIAKQGFGKPQKLDAPVEDTEAKGGGSSWNKAGTFEEKGMMKWVKEKLPQLKVSLDLPQGGKLSTTGVVDITGDASVVVARGKRKHVLDLCFNVEYELKVGDDTGKGKLCYSEVTADVDDTPEVKVDVSPETASSLREVVDAFVKPSGTGLQSAMDQEIKQLIAQFKQL